MIISSLQIDYCAMYAEEETEFSPTLSRISNKINQLKTKLTKIMGCHKNRFYKNCGPYAKHASMLNVVIELELKVIEQKF